MRRLSHAQFQEVISYLILGSEKAILFDTGMGIGRIRSVVEELTALPVRVVNSHTHYDHVGGNAEFDVVLGLDMDYTRQSAGGKTHDQVRDQVAPDALCRPLPEGIVADSYRTRPFKIGGVLKDGDVLALLDHDAGLLLTGDTFYEGPIWLFVAETDLGAYRRSVARLANLVPSLKLLHPAHNTPVAEPRRLQELERALDAVQAGSAKAQSRPGGLAEYEFDGFSLLLNEQAR